MKCFFKISTVFLLMLGLIGCGESSTDGGAASSLTIETEKSVDFSANKMGMNFSVKSGYPNDVEVHLKDLKIAVTPSSCIMKTAPIFTPSDIVLNGNETKNVNAIVEFDNGCTPTSYQLKGTSVLSQNGKSNEVTFASSVQEVTVDTIVQGVSTDGSSAENDDEISYTFKNATSFVIGRASEERTISVDLVDKLGIGVVGKEIFITTLDKQFGSVNFSKAVTDNSGRASFLYTAPVDFDSVKDKNTTVELIFVENKKYIKETIKISFKKAIDNTNTTIKYTFANVPSNVEVTKANQEIFFEVQLIDENQQAVAGKAISTLSYDTSFGRLENMSVTTDANGFARFTFTSADSIDDANGTTLDLTLEYREGTAVISTGVEVAFNKLEETNDIKYTFANVPTGIEVIKDAQKVFFEVQLIDENKEAVSGKTISALSYDTKYGRLDNMSVTTDANGFAQFGLTAPVSIDDVNGTNLKLDLVYREGTAVIETAVTVSFNKKNALALYQFANVPSLLVEYASKTEEISINLVDSNGVGVSGKKLQITTLESQYGSISSSTATTNEAGVATFTYTSPSDVESIDNEGTSVTVRFTEDDFVITQVIQIRFKYSANNNGEESILPTVVIPNSLETIELTANSKTVEMPIQVFKDIAPYDKGTVKVELPSKVLNGVDVGLFEAYEVPVNSQGIATFNYTGPSNLKALMDNNDLESVFKFYHSENTAIENRQIIKVVYNLDEDTYTPIDYVLNITTEGDDFSMGIPNKQKTFSVLLKDSKGEIVENNDVNITKIEVKTENALIAKIFDTQTGTSVNSLILKNENNSAFTLNSEKLSGIAPLKVTIEFKDINDEIKILSTIVNVRVMSGPPSAISVSYVSTEQDLERAKYEEKFAISVTDEYGNKVNMETYISVGAIVGYAVDGQEASSTESSLTKRLFYGQSDIENGIANGTIDNLGDNDANTTQFVDSTPSRSSVFQWVNAEGANSDKLVVFGKGKNYEAMGKWDFSKIDNNTLKLEDDYFGIDRVDLSYAIGRNYYQDQCLDDSREWLGSTDSQTYKLDDEGTAIVSYKYDYHLTGKDALVWVNLNGYQADTEKNTRIGEVTKHTLRGKGLVSRPSGGYFVDKNSTAVVTFNIHHENAPEWYRNGHFAYDVVHHTCASVVEIDSINHHDARSCANNGVAYVTFEVNATEDVSCNFNINNILVSNEF